MLRYQLIQNPRFPALSDQRLRIDLDDTLVNLLKPPLEHLLVVPWHDDPVQLPYSLIALDHIRHGPEKDAHRLVLFQVFVHVNRGYPSSIAPSLAERRQAIA